MSRLCQRDTSGYCSPGCWTFPIPSRLSENPSKAQSLPQSNVEAGNREAMLCPTEEARVETLVPSMPGSGLAVAVGYRCSSGC